MSNKLNPLSPYELGKTGSKKAIPYLIKYLDKGEVGEKRLAASAINKLSKKYKKDVLATIPYLLKTLSLPAPQLRQYSLKALLSIDLTGVSLSKIEKIFNEDEKTYNREIAKNILDKYITKHKNNKTPESIDKRLTIPQLAEKLSLSKEELRKQLHKQQFIYKLDDKWALTDKGVEAGGEYKNYYGKYIVFPESFSIRSDDSKHPLKGCEPKVFEHKSPNLYGAFYLFNYVPVRNNKQDTVSKFLLKFKDNDKKAVKQWIEIASEECKHIFQPMNIDSIIRVLGHKEKKSTKTLTPLDKLGKAIGSAIGSKYEPKTLTKTQTNQSLKFLSKKNRENQLKGIYTYKPSNKNPKSLLLIDDVTTTGTTIAEVCRAIHKSSPDTEIYFLALAKTKRKNQTKKDAIVINKWIGKK